MPQLIFCNFAIKLVTKKSKDTWTCEIFSEYLIFYIIIIISTDGSLKDTLLEWCQNLGLARSLKLKLSSELNGPYTSYRFTDSTPKIGSDSPPRHG